MTLEEIRRTVENTQSNDEEVKRAVQSLDDFFHKNESSLDDSTLVDLIDLRAQLMNRLQPTVERAEAKAEMPQPQPQSVPQVTQTQAKPAEPADTRSHLVVGGIMLAVCAAVGVWIYRHR